MLISDLVPEEADLARIEARLRSINTFAPIVRTTRSEISVESVLNLKAFDLEKTLERDSEFLDTDAEHVHDETISSLGIRSAQDVDMLAFEAFLGGLLREKVSAVCVCMPVTHLQLIDLLMGKYGREPTSTESKASSPSRARRGASCIKQCTVSSFYEIREEALHFDWFECLLLGHLSNTDRPTDASSLSPAYHFGL